MKRPPCFQEEGRRGPSLTRKQLPTTCRPLTGDPANRGSGQKQTHAVQSLPGPAKDGQRVTAPPVQKLSEKQTLCNHGRSLRYCCYKMKPLVPDALPKAQVPKTLFPSPEELFLRGFQPRARPPPLPRAPAPQTKGQRTPPGPGEQGQVRGCLRGGGAPVPPKMVPLVPPPHTLQAPPRASEPSPGPNVSGGQSP